MNAEIEAREEAGQFRTRHGLGSLPLGDLVALIELTQRVDVAILGVDFDEHGMTMRDPMRDVIMVAVARTKNPMRQRSTLAHELGHILFDDYARSTTGGWADRNPEEIRADAFARHLLVPIDGLKNILDQASFMDLADLSMVVQRFQASPAIVAIQLERAGYIDKARKREWQTQRTPSLAARFGWIDQYRAMQQESDTRRAPQRLLARATAGYVANVVSLQAIARLRGINTHTVEEEFTEADIAQIEQSTTWTSAADLPPVEADFGDLDLSAEQE